VPAFEDGSQLAARSPAGIVVLDTEVEESVGIVFQRIAVAVCEAVGPETEFLSKLNDVLVFDSRWLPWM